MSDLISRQEALDTLSAFVSLDEYYHGRKCENIPMLNAKRYLENAPSAEPERKKGEWIEVHGYATPGGDPVWKCSECGKGIHVYGVEAPSYNRGYTDDHQWVACPNCGADMTRGEE